MRTLERGIAITAALTAGAAWVVYAQQDLVLSHYDAKAHLVVARRVIDNLTPGWQQLGAVWLPLPHLINLIPTQFDLLYRTGAFASFVAIVCFALTSWAAARTVALVTGSLVGAMTTAALLVLNPNLLYLHITPMTEPISIAASFVVLLWLYEWVLLSPRSEPLRVPIKLGAALFVAVWTRYEAWLIVAAAIIAGGYALWRRGFPADAVASTVARLTLWPMVAIGLYLIFSRLATGSWFVAGGFYEVDPFYHRLAWRSLVAVWWGTHQLTGYVIVTIALGTAVFLFVRGIRQPDASHLLVLLSLFAAVALPYYAFFEGHPYRVRYMVPLAVTCALFSGIAVGLTRRPVKGRPTTDGDPRTRLSGRRPALHAPALAAVLIGSSLIESPPWNTGAPLLAEAQWDVPRSVGRREVTRCLVEGYKGDRVFASMSSLAHYMQELSREGFQIKDFVHEGNGPLWVNGLERGVASQAGWLLAEEQSEGGDVLTREIRAHPAFIRGMTRLCEGGGVALYKRTESAIFNLKSSID